MWALSISLCLSKLAKNFFFLLRFYLFIFRQREREREREREEHQCLVASHAPRTGEPGLQPRHVPWLGIKPVLPVLHSLALNPLSHTSQGKFLFFLFYNFMHRRFVLTAALSNSPFHLKEALYRFSLAHLNCRYNSCALEPLLGKIRVTWTQALWYHKSTALAKKFV